MKIQLCYRICHTIVLDRDSKFYRVCCEALDLLHINCHIFGGNNHNSMMVEGVKWYLTKGLKMMTNKHDSVRIALEVILLLLYAWNSCPIPGTGISHSLVASGREFAFPIDYSTSKHWKLTSSLKILRPCHMPLCTPRGCPSTCPGTPCLPLQAINSCCPDPCTYYVGDIVFFTVLFDLMHPRNVLTNWPTRSLSLANHHCPKQHFIQSWTLLHAK